MKTVLRVAAFLALATTASAQDTSVQTASDKFEAFHEIMHPAWHDAWPAKDYASLIASGPKFESTYAPIAKLDPSIKNAARKVNFVKFRQEMGEWVAKYVQAAKAGDSMKVYEILPDMHLAFEEAMWLLQPMEFKPLDGMLITVELILDMHLPAENWDGIAGSTETLQMKLGHLTDTSFPAELADAKASMKLGFARAQQLADEMKECADKKDMSCVRAKAIDIKKTLVSLREENL